MTNEITVEEAVKQIKENCYFASISEKTKQALEMAIKALEQQPCEDCISRQALKQKLQEHHDFFVNAYGSFKDMPHDLKVRVDEITNCIAEVVNEPSVTPRTNLAETSQDCINRTELTQKLNAWDGKVHGIPNYAWKVIRELPSVTPERPNPDVVEKMKKAIDEMTEIHSDGEFYIKNVDAKWIINKYLYGAEMSGGEEE